MPKQHLLYFALAGLTMGSAATAGSISQADVTRYLEQSTWGPTSDAVTACQKLGSIDKCLAAEFKIPATLYRVPAEMPPSSGLGCPKGSPATCPRDHYSQYPNQVEFFKHALTGHDQLRQRVAYALHQILVVSGVKIPQPGYYAPYLNVLLDDAFGNFRQLLENITLNPAMGHYLDMVNNDKPSANGKTSPNENYAREVLQLFSIGLNWLNDDGSILLDKQNQPIPTYDQDSIEGFAHVFTGWTFANRNSSSASHFPNPVNYADPMALYRDSKGQDIHHDKSVKTLLSLTPGGMVTTLPANQDAELDLKDALDNIFNHPNVGPYIGKQLIQHLVTSNPSPDYVSRVTQAFNTGKSHGFGSGKRGDMQAVIAAILLDPSARGSAPASANFGHLREPVQFVVNTLKTLNAHSDGFLNPYTHIMGQDLFYPATVFNYYPHQYQAPGTVLQGPEFGIDSSTNALAHENFVNELVFGKIQPDKTSSGSGFDLTPLSKLAVNPTELVAQLNRQFMHGAMSAYMQSELLTAINHVPAKETKLRAQTALYLVLASGQYQIQR
ncbi:DUF1800 domain-containing protein [Methylomonas sp. AM2-LC]|uniref:DUF1800 domain-containing protein n=1 Tax=Methylomonas sp. AM2-LC TaxID=3153301 RepID=UPI003265BD23